VIIGREIATGRKIAIKKVSRRLRPRPTVPLESTLTDRPLNPSQIKVGQFKDGLDMSAIREVKFLRELSHPNVIEVRRKRHPCPRHLPSALTNLVGLSVAACGRVQQQGQPQPCA
jgi:hypothetical protein